MAIHVQGSKLYVLTPDKELITVGCPTNFSPGEISYNEIDTTCLSETDMEQSIDGLAQSTETSFVIIFNPGDTSHMKLYAMSRDRSLTGVKYFFGCGLDTEYGNNYDESATPTYDAATDAVTLPNSRHFWITEGSTLRFPFTAEPKEVMRSSVTFKQTKTWEFTKAKA